MRCLFITSTTHCPGMRRNMRHYNLIYEMKRKHHKVFLMMKRKKITQLQFANMIHQLNETVKERIYYTQLERWLEIYVIST